jgi:hypothetical protein
VWGCGGGRHGAKRDLPTPSENHLKSTVEPEMQLPPGNLPRRINLVFPTMFKQLQPLTELYSPSCLQACPPPCVPLRQ